MANPFPKMAKSSHLSEKVIIQKESIYNSGKKIKQHWKARKNKTIIRRGDSLK